MASDRPSPEAHGGVIRQVRLFFLVFGQYVAARMRLARVEGKEAAAHLLKVVVLVAVSVAFGIFGWLFVCFGVVSWLAGMFTQHGWLWSSLIMAAAHFLVVFALTAALKRKADVPLFPLTTEELKKDQAWLEQQTKQH